MKGNKKYAVNLTIEERQYAQRVKRDVTKCETIRKRAEILLLADESRGKGLKQGDIAELVDTTFVTVSNIAKQFHLNGIKGTLSLKKRSEPPRPSIVTGEIEARIIATACGEPPEGYSRWTVRLLTEKIIELRIMPSGSRETVRRVLKKRNLSLT